MTRLLLVDDHAVVRSGLKMLLGSHSEMEIVGEADSAAGAMREAERTRPDVILLKGAPGVGGPDSAVKPGAAAGFDHPRVTS